MKSLLLLVTFILIGIKIYSQESNYYEKFIEKLINDDKELSEYFSVAEKNSSSRLGIDYTGVKHKLLISYDIEKEIKTNIVRDNLPYELSANKINDSITLVHFRLSAYNYNKIFYFLNDNLISPLTYFSNEWERNDSKYFEFYLSKPIYFNEFCKKYLDSFVDSILVTLKLTESEKELLSKEKILYFLCSDENEIERVTGYKTKGMYMLSTDAIVTTYNCHFHEIAHLLMNYKLKSLPLYTLPFIQEGFAVAVGGRGGLSSNVLMNIGYFTVMSGFINFNSVLTKENFQSEDPSITYPVSGLFSRIFLDKFNIEKYLEAYKQLSGPSEFVSGLDSLSIQSQLLFQDVMQFSKTFMPPPGILFDIDQKIINSIYKGNSGEVFETESFYFFKIKNSVLITGKGFPENYISKKYEEIFPGRKYSGEKYCLIVGPEEIKLYNLFSNELIVSYDEGFSFDRQLNQTSSPYEFFISKNVFEEPLSGMKIER